MGEGIENNINKDTSQAGEIPRTERGSLPIVEYRDSILEQIRNNPTTIVMGETGSGKTTEIPGFLIDEYPNKRIAITQPRRIATRSVSEYVAERRGVEIGGEVGYRMRFEDRTSEGTMANFMTDGILLQEMHSDPLLLAYDVVMIDEAHERSLNIDFLLGLLKKAQKERKERGEKELKILVTSATLEKEKFAEYFDYSPVVEVPGRVFPIDTNYKRVEATTNRGEIDYTTEAALVVREIAEKGVKGDILIFMPREQEILATIETIKKLGLPNLDILPLYGALPPEEQRKVFAKSSGRKVIVATNIAETSITIDGVRFVIDSGLINEKDFNPDTGIESTNVRRHAKSGCNQRKGRAGRTAPGICYRLYEKQDFDERNEFQKPEIARSDLDHVVLTMKKMGIDDVINFDFIEPPEKESIKLAIETLKALGALDDKENITELGYQMSELPLKPELAKMLIEAEEFGCTESICTIVAMMGGKNNVFFRPRDPDQQVIADSAHRQFKVPGSDFLTLRNVWNEWERNGFNPRWARDNFLNARQLFEAREIRDQLFRKLYDMRVPTADTANEGQIPEFVGKAITAGMIRNLYVSGGFKSYRKVVDTNDDVFKDDVYIHPSSSVFHAVPTFMIGANVVKTSKTYARMCQEVEQDWLPEIAPELFNPEVEDDTHYFEPRKDRVVRSAVYRFKNNVYTKIRAEIPISDQILSSMIFIGALIEGKVFNEQIQKNKEAFEKLKSLHDRSGGQVELPDMKEWYKKRIKGATTNAELMAIDDSEITFDIDSYCPPDFVAAIEKKYPSSFMVNGREIEILYEYISPEMATFGIEKHEAQIILPSDLLDINDEDIPKIGESSKPNVVFRLKRFGMTMPQEYRSLAEAKKAMLGHAENRYSANSTYSPYSPYKREEPPQEKGFKINAFDDVQTTRNPEVTQPIKEKAPKPEKVKEPIELIMTDEIRARFDRQLGEMEFILDTLREVVLSKKKSDETDRLKEKLKELRKKFTEKRTEVKDSIMITVIKSTLGSLSADIQRMVKDFERSRLLPEGWNKKYEDIMEKTRQQAQKDGFEINNSNLSPIRKKVAQLAMEEMSPATLQEKLEEMMIEMI